MKLLSTLLVWGTMFVASSHCDKVPVFLWGTKTVIHTPALKTHDSENFYNFLSKQQYDEAVTVVFYENNLGTQDLTQCKTEEGTSCFQYLNSIKPSSYLPSVEDPISTLERLHDGNQLSTHLNTDGSFNFNYNDVEKGDIIFCALADIKENEDSVVLFSRHDGMIRKFVEQLTPKFEVIGIYTGNHAPIVHSLHKRETSVKDTKSEVPSIGSTTRATKADNSTGHIFSNDRVLMYFTRLRYTTADGNMIDFNATDCSIVNSTEKQIHVNLTGSDDSFSFEINEYSDMYTIDNAVFNSLQMRFEQISVNLDFSFHCGPGVIFRSKSSDIMLIWEGLQIQPQFNRSKSFNETSFSEAWDCVGFTSGGVWMGLAISFLLLGVVSCGFSWMFDIKTMDRFDDPKGKTITVTEME